MRSPAGLYLLFGPSSRPRRSDVLAALKGLPDIAVSHDPASSTAEPGDDAAKTFGMAENWLELLISGMTFDLLGLAPGPGMVKPQIAHRIACDSDADLESMEALALVAGPHLADAANSLPIVRAMLKLGCGLASVLDGANTLCWSPARTAMAKSMFCGSVDRWLGGGPVPGLGLTAFRVDQDGALSSEGLDFFVDQELRLSPDLAQDRIAATRLGVRLVHEIVGTGRVDVPREFVTEAGERVWLEPQAATGLIEVVRM